MEERTIESFPMPCSFVEVIIPQDHAQLASGYTVSDVVFRVHVAAVEYDAQNGTLEQNYSIFTLRDTVVALLTYYEPRGCSHLQKISEQQDYEHTDVYHYIIDFKCSFIDTTGAEVTYFKAAPTTLDLTVTII